MKSIHLLLMITAVISVALADIFLKKAAANGSLWQALRSPWMIGAILLYLNQIFFFTYFFVRGWELSLVGSLQTVLYALIVVGAGVFLMQESLTRLQLAGVILAVGGAVLINLK